MISEVYTWNIEFEDGFKTSLEFPFGIEDEDGIITDLDDLALVPAFEREPNLRTFLEIKILKQITVTGPVVLDLDDDEPQYFVENNG